MSVRGSRPPIAAILAVPLLLRLLAPGHGTAGAEPPTADGSAVKWQKLGASSGRPLIFLPALGLPGQCWANVYDQFKAAHPIYVVTYAGSGDAPTTRPPYFAKIVRGLHELITSEKLEKPVLIGHFLGLQLALHVAADYPTEVGGVFGLPLISTRPPLDQRREAGERVTASYLESDPELWIPTMAQKLRGVVRDPATSDKLLEMIKNTDRETYAHMMGEMAADQLEECLPRIECPVYLIATVPQQQRRETLEVGQERLAAISQGRVDVIRSLFPGIAKCNVTALRNVELYAMIESANRMVFPLQRFLKRLDDPKSRWESTRAGVTTQTSTDGLEGR